MSGILDIGDHLERELTAEPIAGPAAGALGLHLALGALLLGYAWMLDCFITISGAVRAPAEPSR